MIIVSVIFFCLTCAEVSIARYIGTVGEVYKVVEPDALIEIQEAAARVDWNKVMGRERMQERIKKFRPDGLHSLPTASEERAFHVNLTYTLDMDIPDGKGGIIYPKDYSFNPLDYLNLSSVLVVINGDDQRQVTWFKSSSYADDYRTRLLLSGGGYYELSEELKRPVFYLQDNVASRLQLSAVPSVVRQNGRVLEVTEVRLDD